MILVHPIGDSVSVQRDCNFQLTNLRGLSYSIAPLDKEGEDMKKIKQMFSAFLVLALLFGVPISGQAATGDSNFTNVVATGDVTFRSTLISVGRTGGASSINSSSTYLTSAGIAYSIIRKRIGGGGGLDSTNGGTSLPNGTPGQVLSFIITTVQSGGSWIITPVTKTGFSTITFDTANDLATLLYVDDTTGWIILSQAGCTVA